MDCNLRWNDEASLWRYPAPIAENQAPYRSHHGTLAEMVRAAIEEPPETRRYLAIYTVTAHRDLRADDIEGLADQQSYPFKN